MDPELENIICLDVHLDTPGVTRILPKVFDGIRARCRILAEETVADRASHTPRNDPSDPYAGCLRNHKSDETMVQRLKALKRGERLTVGDVWDDQTGTYASDNEKIAEVFIRAARERQGSGRGASIAGQRFLDSWAVDFSRCRTSLTLNEVERIIRDGPKGKRPGPDGVPAEIFQRYSAQLANMFLEAWGELQNDVYSNDMYRILALKTWMVVPKIEGANRVDKFRDLEMGNESRKILARMLNRLLDEVCSCAGTGLSSCQQAFVSGRDIVRNTSSMLRVFWDNVEHRDHTDNPLLMLLLDCSKGYNLMSRDWVVRVLEKAGLPGCLVTLVANMMVSVAILLLNGTEHDPLELLSGLTQGCPASCFLYIIAVDPLLQALQATDGVQIVSGFVDDWSAGCDDFNTLGRVSCLISEFEQASGQQINRDKSALVPSRRLRAEDLSRCEAELGWPLRVSYRERLLGIYIGIDASIEDQYKDAMNKFGKNLVIFTASRSTSAWLHVLSW